MERNEREQEENWCRTGEVIPKRSPTIQEALYKQRAEKEILEKQERWEGFSLSINLL